MKHIAIFVPSMRGGGAERIMMTLANRFAALGHRVDLVLVNAEGPYLAQISTNVRIVDLKASRTLSSLPALVRYIKCERPQAMLAAMLHANVIAVLARALSGISTRLVISERNTTSRDLASLSPLTAFVMKWAIRWTYPHADLVTTVSAGVADDLAHVAHMNRAALRVIYNPIHSDELLQASMLSPEHPWLPEDNSEALPVILAAGRLNEQKDFQTLLRSFALLKTKARLIILGKGAMHSELKGLIETLDLKQDVSLHGFTDNPFAFMRRCTVFVLSSRWEGLPGVLVQAMACGARVVSTDCPSGADEILENGRWGELVPVADPQAMANAIEKTLQKDSPPDVTKRAKEFDVESAANNYLNSLNAL